MARWSMYVNMMNIFMCRSILSLHLKKSKITATRGELRRFPLGIYIAANVIQFSKYLEIKSDASIVHKAFQLSKTLKQPPNSRKAWASETSKLIEFVGAAIRPKTKNKRSKDLGALLDSYS